MITILKILIFRPKPILKLCLPISPKRAPNELWKWMETPDISTGRKCRFNLHARRWLNRRYHMRFVNRFCWNPCEKFASSFLWVLTENICYYYKVNDKNKEAFRAHRGCTYFKRNDGNCSLGYPFITSEGWFTCYYLKNLFVEFLSVGVPIFVCVWLWNIFEVFGWWLSSVELVTFGLDVN